MLKVVATTRTEIEAALVMGRLDEAGIPCMRKGDSGRYYEHGITIYVEDTHLERARETLKADEGNFDEAELTRLSEEACAKWSDQKPAEQPLAEQQPPRDDSDQAGGRDTPAQPAKPPADPTRHGLLSAVERLTRRADRQDRSPNPFGH